MTSTEHSSRKQYLITTGVYSAPRDFVRSENSVCESNAPAVNVVKSENSVCESNALAANAGIVYRNAPVRDLASLPKPLSVQDLATPPSHGSHIRVAYQADLGPECCCHGAPHGCLSPSTFHFHLCFVNGCDASVLLDDTPLMKQVSVSPALSKFLGVSEVSHLQATKKTWECIKANNLQNPSKKTEIYCHVKLKSIFEDGDSVSMLEIAKLLSPHFPKAKK